jgi:preprotein translocase subunit YajC
MVQNNSTSKIVQIIPILGILLILAVQYFHANQQLQANDELVRKQLENLKTGMREDNVPPNIERHISTVAQNAAFQTRLLFSSLTTMEVFFQFNILLMVYLFYTTQKSKTKKTEEQNEQ